MEAVGATRSVTCRMHWPSHKQVTPSGWVRDDTIQRQASTASLHSSSKTRYIFTAGSRAPRSVWRSAIPARFQQYCLATLLTTSLRNITHIVSSKRLELTVRHAWTDLSFEMATTIANVQITAAEECTLKVLRWSWPTVVSGAIMQVAAVGYGFNRVRLLLRTAGS